MATPILPFAVWPENIQQADIPANDNSLRSEILQGLVISDVITAPPGGSAEGDIYILPATHTGAWSGFSTNDLVIYDGATWHAYTPVDGVRVNVNSTMKEFSGSSGWQPFSGMGSSVTSVNGATGAVTLADLQESGLNVDAVGFRGVPSNSQSGNYTCVASDAGKSIDHPSGAGAGDTFTIPSNASVAFEIGTCITFTNMATDALSIAINSDTMNLAGAGTTGTRTLAQYGIATARKQSSTVWLISGTGLT